MRQLRDFVACGVLAVLIAALCHVVTTVKMMCQNWPGPRVATTTTTTTTTTITKT